MLLPKIAVSAHLSSHLLSLLDLLTSLLLSVTDSTMRYLRLSCK